MPKNLREKAKLEDALTIARAELIAMVCCVTMMDYLREAYNPHLTSDKVFIFTDSLLNLQRIQRGKGKCKPFEERRVCKVLDGKGEATVRFCPGVENPSDLPSRGCNLAELQERMDFWKEGPDFLKLPVAEWPKPPAVSEKIKDEASSQSSLYSTRKKLPSTLLSSALYTTSAFRKLASSCPINLQRLLTSRLIVRNYLNDVRHSGPSEE